MEKNSNQEPDGEDESRAEKKNNNGSIIYDYRVV